MAILTESPPELIGPYRIGERLGRGGMGEVFRGFDDRLDRPVALKRVRPGVGDPELALRRFRREARAAAQLRHPSIVQVHDWIEHDGEAWLVMELVEGRPLRELLQKDPLEPQRAMALTRDLLEGLEVAHSAGLVHRDLKIDNVMIAPATWSGRGRGEQAKILDFGLAKKTAQEAEETILSMEGKIVGTLSALAPEQILGQEVDARTDLFALGCLLYEILTGKQPFVGRNAGETLNRICTVYQLSAADRRPEIPPALSDFIDHLLEKDPRRRPTSAADAFDELERVSSHGQDLPKSLTLGDLATAVDGVAQSPENDGSARSDRHLLPRRAEKASSPMGSRLALPLFALAMLIAGTWWVLDAIAPRSPIYVVVPETDIQATADDEAELTAQAVHTALLQGLVDLQDVVPLEVPANQNEAADPQALARALGAHEVLASRVECSPRGCRAELRRLDGVDAGVIWVKGFTVDSSHLINTSQAVLSYLSSGFADFKRRPGSARWHVKPPDYEDFLRLKKRFESRDQGISTEQFLTELARLSGSSPQFAAIPVLQAHVLLQRFQSSRDQSDLDFAQRSLARARKLAPEDPQVLMLAARAAHLAGDLDRAAESLDEVRRLEPGDGQALVERAFLHERRDEFDQAVELAREAARRQPSVPLLLNVSDLFSRRGDIEAAKSFIEEALSRAPDSFGGLSRLAQIELAHGDLERAAALYIELVKRSPEEPELTNLGTAYLMLGRFDQAATYFEQVVETNPKSPFATLNLADVEKLRGSPERSSELYNRVVALAQNDPEPERLASVQAQALAHLGRHQEAVATIQVAIRMRPEHPWTAYEAALVHTLVEDRSSAVWHAHRALELGIEPRWLTLPFFDPIRDALESGG